MAIVSAGGGGGGGAAANLCARTTGAHEWRRPHRLASCLGLARRRTPSQRKCQGAHLRGASHAQCLPTCADDWHALACITVQACFGARHVFPIAPMPGQRLARPLRVCIRPEPRLSIFQFLWEAHRHRKTESRRVTGPHARKANSSALAALSRISTVDPRQAQTQNAR